MDLFPDDLVAAVSRILVPCEACFSPLHPAGALSEPQQELLQHAFDAGLDVRARDRSSKFEDLCDVCGEHRSAGKVPVFCKHCGKTRWTDPQDERIGRWKVSGWTCPECYRKGPEEEF